MSSPTQQTDLFAGAGSGIAPVSAAAPRPEHVELARAIPQGIRFGTSSWTFPGWAGLVYDRQVSQSTLVRHGLEAYARHPLLRTVGVDRTYYQPLSRAALRAYLEAVPPGFRFLMKAPRDSVMPTLGPPGGPAPKNPAFLDPDWVSHAFVEPVMEVLGAAAGPLVFQFPPLDAELTRDPGRFADRLHAFLGELPRGPLYAVELRNPELLTRAYARALRETSAVHCLNVHPSMPPLESQRSLLAPDLRSPLVVRWMLGHGQRYEAARDRYHPFDRLVDEDSVSRIAIGKACLEAAAAEAGVFVVVNNKAEGSSPLSVFKLAEWVAGGR